jgi:hypothetical protein
VVKKTRPIPEKDILLTMAETMKYLADRNVPCSSRKSFYRLLEDYKIPYINTNPRGKHEIRRFKISDLEKFLKKYGWKSG